MITKQLDTYKHHSPVHRVEYGLGSARNSIVGHEGYRSIAKSLIQYRWQDLNEHGMKSRLNISKAGVLVRTGSRVQTEVGVGNPNFGAATN